MMIFIYSKVEKKDQESKEIRLKVSIFFDNMPKLKNNWLKSIPLNEND